MNSVVVLVTSTILLLGGLFELFWWFVGLYGCAFGGPPPAVCSQPYLLLLVGIVDVVAALFLFKRSRWGLCLLTASFIIFLLLELIAVGFAAALELELFFLIAHVALLIVYVVLGRKSK